MNKEETLFSYSSLEGKVNIYKDRIEVKQMWITKNVIPLSNISQAEKTLTKPCVLHLNSGKKWAMPAPLNPLLVNRIIKEVNTALIS